MIAARVALVGIAVIACACGDEAGTGGDGASGGTDGVGPTTSSGEGASGGMSEGGASSGGAGVGGASDLVHLDDFVFDGGFRIPAGDFGESHANYAAGPIAYNASRDSLFIVGFAQVHPLAEFAIPGIVKSDDLDALPLADSPLQGFTTILDDVAGGNPQDLDTISGMGCFEGPNGTELIVNALEYYDAPADNTLTTLVVRDASNIGGTKAGWFSFGGRAHASGWISEVPSEHRAALGGPFITGGSSGTPIISRHSVGPTAFVFDPADLAGAGGQVPTAALLDFDLALPLADDLSNDSGENDLWTHLSHAAYGFIAPGTRTYVTLGNSGGHESGVCYKCTPVGATAECGGYCARNADDNYNFYWLFDVDDLVAVKNGEKAPHEVRPYEHGKFPSPFGGTLLGGAFDAVSGRLYLNFVYADDSQGEYDRPPLILAFSIK